MAGCDRLSGDCVSYPICSPSNTKNTIGFTYSRAPEGYGAWYAYMQEQGVSTQRWQKSFKAIKDQKLPLRFYK